MYRPRSAIAIWSFVLLLPGAQPFSTGRPTQASRSERPRKVSPIGAGQPAQRAEPGSSNVILGPDAQNGIRTGRGGDLQGAERLGHVADHRLPHGGRLAPDGYLGCDPRAGGVMLPMP